MNDNNKITLLSRMMQGIAQTDNPFETDAPRMQTVKRSDGTYRNSNIFGQQFFPSSAYIGKKCDFILCFTPEDPQEYDLAEVRLKDLDEVFPLFASSVSQWILREFSESADVLKVNDTLPLETLIETLWNLEEHRSNHLDASEEEYMKTIPGYGMF